MQKEDLNKAIQKKFHYLQWEQGAGKTAAGFAWALWMAKQNRLDNVYLVGPAIAIKNTWIDFLKFNNQAFTFISSIGDICRIKKGDFVLLSFESLIKVNRQLKKHLKKNNYRIVTLLDEGDNISNPIATRTKVTLSVFQDSKAKMILSGTMTRNNILESYTQFYFLYGSTSNFMCTVRDLYYEQKEDKSDKAYKKACKRAGIVFHEEVTQDGLIKRFNQEYRDRPFPAYLKGWKLFRACFNPCKSTVFGIKKQNQAIFNPDELKRIIDYTVITRRFEEIRGDKIYQISQEYCGFNKMEVVLYRKIIKEFDELRKRYFKATGNARKDAMLKIILQLNLLFKACSIPNSFPEYTTQDDPSKIIKVMDMIEYLDKVAIGCIRKETVAIYERIIREVYPDRLVFVITGERASISKRRKIVAEMKKHKKFILIATQQSLSCSMNIDFINDIFIPELQWNSARMSQFYFRFIRYSSKNKKNVTFITYANSMEANLLQLIINKDKLNYFMKNQNLDMSELYDKYGVIDNLMDMVLSREFDAESECLKIRWDENAIKTSAGRRLVRREPQILAGISGSPGGVNTAFEKGLLFDF
jgi:hypothetical protein